MDVESWTPSEVADWLSGLNDDSTWLNRDLIIESNTCGSKLLLMGPVDLIRIGAIKVNLQEEILSAIDKLKHYTTCLSSETLQKSIMRLSCHARSLQRSLTHEREMSNNLKCHTPSIKSSSSTHSKEMDDDHKQRVSLETLTAVSEIAVTAQHIVNLINKPPFSKRSEYRSMKSLLLVFCIELTSTAQRDQFVHEPNDVIEKCSKSLSDYCDKLVTTATDPLLIEPCQLETIRLKKSINSKDLGLTIGSSPDDTTEHYVEKVTPILMANKTNKLNEGDEIVQFNGNIIGWSSKKVAQLIRGSNKLGDVVVTVKKLPSE